MHCLRGRIIKPEILDTLPPDQARASLADLTRINKTWGGHGTLRKLLRENIHDAQFSLLDVGAASGDMARQIREIYPKARVTSLDRIATHLAAAPDPRVAADAFGLPFRPKSFDYVFSSLFLHHFTDDEVVRLFEEFSRAARKAVLVIDLDRNPIAYYFLPWTRWLFGWDPVTVNDGPISVEAAFHPDELEALARRAGLRDPRAKSYWPAFRIAMTANVA
ncbi:MAG: methyltransferase domain-containing protein [Acidobacteriia bacterium]|nr:methyltransferase domain-containing protein [Terriglobia bacterium]